jgi:tRNA nucleotidyltransferase (CCA-adding enzyme)
LQIYLVGGAVRDKLLGLPVRERDWVVVGATPTEMLKKGFKKVGKDFPVFLHPKTQEEYALARTERKTGRGYYAFECYASPEVSLEEDLLRRDLTINAMAEDAEGQIIDPFHGQSDLKHKILRHVSPAFKEDPIRILRVARFAARFEPLGFKIAEETLELMREMVTSGEVDALVKERVWQEMVKALAVDKPSEFFLTLRSCGALEHLWPSLDKLWGIPQPIKHHPEIDTGIHTMMALLVASKLSKDTVTRFAALCHDLGKGQTPPEEWPSHRGHEERGVELIKAFCNQYKVAKEYKNLAVLVSRFHLHCHKVFELKAKTLLTTLEKLDAFRKPKRFEQFLIACQADAEGRLGQEEKQYTQATRMREAYKIAKAVEIQPLVGSGLTGTALGQKLREKRIQALKQAFKDPNTS